MDFINAETVDLLLSVDGMLAFKFQSPKHNHPRFPPAAGFSIADASSADDDAKSTRPHVYVHRLPVLGEMFLRIVISLTLTVFVMLVAGCQRVAEKEHNPPVVLPVMATTVHCLPSFGYEVTYYGRVEPARRAALSFERSGRLTQVLIDEGKYIASGQIVARLDTAMLEAERDVLVRQHRTETLLLDRLKRGERDEVVAAGRAGVMRLEVELSRALADQLRAESLFPTKAISRAELDDAQFTYKAAVHALEQARQRQSELELGSRIEDIEAQQSRVNVIAAQLKMLDVQFEKSVLVAPFDGISIQRFLDEGEIVAPGQAVIEIHEANQLEARFSIPYANMDLIADVKSFQINGRQYMISERRAIANIDDVMRTIDLLIPFRVDPKDHIFPGQTCTLALSKVVPIECIEVPLSSLVPSIRGLWSCYRLQPTEASRHGLSESQTYTVEKVEVTLVHADGSRALISKALAEGSLIVTNGVERIVPGMQVQIIESAP